MTMNPKTKPAPVTKQKRKVPGPGATTETRKRKLLVVDDDRQIREALRKLLHAEGYEVGLAATGQEGIEKFNAERFDLLLLDLNLPDHNGWDVFETLTARNP